MTAEYFLPEYICLTLLQFIVCGTREPAQLIKKEGVKEFTEYHPTSDHREEYENIFKGSRLFREMIIKMNKI